MRIVHVITRLILGGAQENTLLTCEGLHARGHEVTLITGPPLGPEGELMTRALAGGYRVIVIDSLRRAIHPLRDWATGHRIMRHLWRLEPDIVHTHSSKAGILARQAAWDIRGRIPGMKIVHTIHGLPFHPYETWWRNRLYVALERRAARQSDAIISVADAMTHQALAAGVGRPEQYATIYSGMEVASYVARPPGVDGFRAALGLGADDLAAVQVSRLAELKGHEYILQALARIEDPRIHAVFVGDGRRRGWIEGEIVRLGLSRRVHLTGLLPPERIPTVMHAADIVVHCSLREGLARALPQGMLAGKPVVSFDVDGAREVVDETTGILLAPCDVEGLTHAITVLASDPTRRIALGLSGRARAERMFDHVMMIDRLEKLYGTLCRSGA